jgi:anti-sigma-K factor RskA
MSGSDFRGTSAGAPNCRVIRQLLGVYVVGAIEPSDRTLVDDHVSECQACRDELAGLAGLPAMLGRIPLAEAEQIAAAGTIFAEVEEPSADMLNSLLRKVWLKRRARTWRAVAAAAAVVVVAASSAVAAVELTVPQSQVVSATSASTHDGMVVDYSAASWGSAMRVRVTGVGPGTACRFWVLSKSGSWVQAGSWTTAARSSYSQAAQSPWYSASAQLAVGSVRGFQLTSGGKVLVSISVR